MVKLANGSSLIVQIQTGTRTFQPGTNLVEGNFCYPFSPATQSVQAYFVLLTGSSCFVFAASNSIAPCPVSPTCSTSLPDVQPTYKFYDEVKSLSALNLVSGYEDGSFKPDEKMARGSAVKLLVQTFDIPVEAGSTQHFADVPPGSPYFAYVEAAYKKGLVNGYKDGTFRPEGAITRGALVKMAVQAAGWELVKPQKPTFRDVGADSPFYSYVETAAAHGILDNVAAPGGLFQAGKEATRGETAAIIARAMPSPISRPPKSLEALLRKLLGLDNQTQR